MGGNDFKEALSRIYTNKDTSLNTSSSSQGSQGSPQKRRKLFVDKRKAAAR